MKFIKNLIFLLFLNFIFFNFSYSFENKIAPCRIENPVECEKESHDFSAVVLLGVGNTKTLEK